MAITSSSTGYGGEVDNIVMPIFGVDNEIAQKGIARIHDNIRYKKELNRISGTANPIGAYVTGELSTDTITTTKTPRSLSVDKGTVGERFYPVDFLPDWDVFASKGDLTNLELNLALLNAWLTVNKPAIGLQIAKNCLQGNKTGGVSGLTLTNGIIQKIGLDSDVVTIGNIGEINKDSFFDILSLIIKAIPDIDKENPDFKILMNYGDWEDVELGNIEDTKAYRGVLGLSSPKEFVRTRIEPLFSMPENTIIATIATDSPMSNLHLGYYFSENQETELIGRMAPSSNQWFIRLDLTLGAQYTAGEKIIYYAGSGDYTPVVG